mgnify:FL=1
MKRTIDEYVKAQYPRESIEVLERLESSCERLGELLESYRDLQPDEKLFSPETIVKIADLHILEEVNANKKKKEGHFLEVLGRQVYRKADVLF